MFMSSLGSPVWNSKDHPCLRRCSRNFDGCGHSPARDSAETLYSTGQVKHTVKATRTQVREFAFFRELRRQITRWFPLAGFPFLDYVLYTWVAWSRSESTSQFTAFLLLHVARRS